VIHKPQAVNFPAKSCQIKRTSTILTIFYIFNPQLLSPKISGWFLLEEPWNSDVQSSEVIQIPKPWDGGMAEKSLNKPGIKKPAMLATVEKSPLYIYILYPILNQPPTISYLLNPIDVRYFSCINSRYSDLKQLFKMILKMAISIHIIHTTLGVPLLSSLPWAIQNENLIISKPNLWIFRWNFAGHHFPKFNLSPNDFGGHCSQAASWTPTDSASLPAGVLTGPQLCFSEADLCLGCRNFCQTPSVGIWWNRFLESFENC